MALASLTRLSAVPPTGQAPTLEAASNRLAYFGQFQHKQLLIWKH